ncbi:unnamed protein product [Sphagnum balticum]
MKKYALLVALLVATPVFAQDEFLIDAGLGAFSTIGDTLAQVKFGKIGLQEDLWYALKQRFNVGGWLDARDGMANSGFAGYQLGFVVQNDIYEMSIFSGPSVITSPDTSLGGRFQFNETVFFGIKDKLGNSIGAAYNHFSSAGIEMPNLGKDFLCLEIKFPF